MPHIVPTQTTARQIAEGDILNGVEVATKKVGTKWAELRDSEGKLIARVQADTELTVSRSVPTDEEVAEAKAKRAAETRQWLVEDLQRDHRKRLENTPTAYLARVQANAAKTSDPDFHMFGYSDFSGLMEVQAEYNLAARVDAVAERWAEQGLPEAWSELGWDIDPLTAAYAMICANDSQPHPRNPLNRSTSVTSNLMEDMVVFVAREMVETGWNTDLKKAFRFAQGRKDI